MEKLTSSEITLIKLMLEEKRDEMLRNINSTLCDQKKYDGKNKEDYINLTNSLLNDYRIKLDEIENILSKITIVK